MASYHVSQGEVSGKGQKAGLTQQTAPAEEAKQDRRNRGGRSSWESKPKTAAQAWGDKRVAYTNGLHPRYPMDEGEVQEVYQVDDL